jgi:hypothetical protein
MQARKGFNRIRFQGRLTKRKRLRRGVYRITFRAVGRDGQRSNRARARFSLLPPRR